MNHQSLKILLYKTDNIITQFIFLLRQINDATEQGNAAISQQQD